ncbi:MAG TPA: alpha/beta hydrolase [Steroidobacteraceae bacterium]|nr:alpha/beta hydrolase [Steroidobacteraceae bacterium]
MNESRRARGMLVLLCMAAAMSSGRVVADSPASAGPQQILIWQATAPDVQPVPGPATDSTNIVRPTMTLYFPTRKNTGVAVVVFPGGGFEGLAIGIEGTDACDWLTSRGITCVLLRYRVPSLPYDWHCKCRPDNLVTPTQALEDAQRTLGLVRYHAAKWHIDPHRIGVLGFSAGGFVLAEISTRYQHRLYGAVDAADAVSCRPDFAMAIYPGHLWAGGKGYPLNPIVPVTNQTPPTFLVQAEDDSVDGVHQSIAYYIALKDAGVPVEMHLYAQGGHAFGLRRTRLPITNWPQLADEWLATIGMFRK